MFPDHGVPGIREGECRREWWCSAILLMHESALGQADYLIQGNLQGRCSIADT